MWIYFYIVFNKWSPFCLEYFSNRERASPSARTFQCQIRIISTGENINKLNYSIWDLQRGDSSSASGRPRTWTWWRVFSQQRPESVGFIGICGQTGRAAADLLSAGLEARSGAEHPLLCCQPIPAGYTDPSHTASCGPLKEKSPAAARHCFYNHMFTFCPQPWCISMKDALVLIFK